MTTHSRPDRSRSTDRIDGRRHDSGGNARARVGSTNLDWRSFLHNQELTAVILGSEFGAKMHAAFERDLAASDQLTLEA
jgi:phosphatidylserine/phosphatidylglycerophosphate/cardiolipin synthase-like enzyme